MDSFARTYMGCSSIALPSPTYSFALKNQVVIAGKKITYSVGTNFVSNCMEKPMTPLISVANYVTLPSFVSVAWGL
jgi:hypothetical protein